MAGVAPKRHKQRAAHDSETCTCDDCLVEAYGYDWRQMVPNAGWLRDYVEYALYCTDAPPMFHIATGLTILATVLGAGCDFKPDPYDDHTEPINMWTLIAGQSAADRKSTSVRLAKEMLAQKFGHMIIPWNASAEELFSQITVQPCCILVVPEFPAMLAAMDQNYARRMKTDLMDLYDSDDIFSRATRKKGTETIDRPRVNMLGGAALDLLDRHLKNIDFRGGFLSRMFIVSATRLKMQPQRHSDPKTVQNLQDQLFDISRWATAQRVISSSTETYIKLEEYAISNDRRRKITNPAYQSIVDRAREQAKKILAILAGSMKQPCAYHQLVPYAVKLAEHSIGTVEHYFTNMMSDSPYIRSRHKIVGYLKSVDAKQGDRVRIRDIMRATHLDSAILGIGLQQLQDEEILSPPLVDVADKSRGRPPRVLAVLTDDF